MVAARHMNSCGTRPERTEAHYILNLKLRGCGRLRNLMRGDTVMRVYASARRSSD